MKMLMMLLLIVIILSNYYTVCEVDPSDMALIMLQQLKVHTKQLEIDHKALTKQQEQLQIQSQQLPLLRIIQNQFYPLLWILIVVLSTGLLSLFVYVIRLYRNRFAKRYASPEMPQTVMQLMDLAEAPSDQYVEHFINPRFRKSPAASGESSSE